MPRSRPVSRVCACSAENCRRSHREGRRRKRLDSYLSTTAPFGYEVVACTSAGPVRLRPRAPAAVPVSASGPVRLFAGVGNVPERGAVLTVIRAGAGPNRCRAGYRP